MSGVAKFGAAAIEAIQRQRWLDTPGYKLEHGLALTFNLLGARSRAVQDVLHGRWLGHPLHPTLTSLPIGAWTAAVVLDAVDVVSSQGEGFRRAAQFAVGLGVLGGAGAALTGVTDWQHTQDKPRRSGLVHGLVNSVALGLNIFRFTSAVGGGRRGPGWPVWPGTGSSLPVVISAGIWCFGTASGSITASRRLDRIVSSR